MLVMLFALGVILMVTAFSGTYAQLATELETDIPGFFRWGFALAAIVAFGYVPGMKTVSRWLLALVLLVLVLKSWPQIQAQLTNFMNQGAAAANSNTSATNAVVQSAATTAAQGAAATSPLPVTSNLLGGQTL